MSNLIINTAKEIHEQCQNGASVSDIISLLGDFKEQFSLNGVVASLLCVDSEGLSFIMEGETYNLLEESGTLYKIADDDGDEFWYDKKHFVKNKK